MGRDHMLLLHGRLGVWLLIELPSRISPDIFALRCPSQRLHAEYHSERQHDCIEEIEKDKRHGEYVEARAWLVWESRGNADK